MPLPSTELSVTTITALATAGAVLIAAFFAGLVSVITAWRTIAQKVTAIEAHTNSEKTAADGRETTLKRENELLRELLTEGRQTAAVLAQAASYRQAAPAAALPPLAATPVLDQIDVNTAATAHAVENLKGGS